MKISEILKAGYSCDLEDLGLKTKQFTEIATIIIDELNSVSDYNTSAKRLCRSASKIIMNIKIWMPHTFSIQQEENIESAIKDRFALSKLCVGCSKFWIFG